MGRRRMVGVYIDPQVDREVEHLSVDTGRTKSELYELGARVVVDLVRSGDLAPGTKAMLEELRKTIAASKVRG